MSGGRFWLGGLVAMAAAMAAAAPSGPQGAGASAGSPAWRPPADDAERFSPIVEINIFDPDRAGLAAASRTRSAPPEPAPAHEAAVAPPPAPPPDPDGSMVVVGMARRGEQVAVFVEDRSTGQTHRVAVPAEFSRGRIAGFEDGAVVYEIDERARRVRVGQTLAGGSPEESSGESGGSGAQPRGAGAEAASSIESEILRRLRERRESEQSFE